MENRSIQSEYWQRAVAALASGELPVFAGDSQYRAFTEFVELFEQMEPGAIGAALAEQVSETSSGRVRLEVVDSELFMFVATTLAAVYLRLTVDGQSRLLAFEAQETPFRWDQGRPVSPDDWVAMCDPDA